MLGFRLELLSCSGLNLLFSRCRARRKTSWEQYSADMLLTRASEWNSRVRKCTKLRRVPISSAIPFAECESRWSGDIRIMAGVVRPCLNNRYNEIPKNRWHQRTARISPLTQIFLLQSILGSRQAGQLTKGPADTQAGRQARTTHKFLQNSSKRRKIAQRPFSLGRNSSSSSSGGGGGDSKSKSEDTKPPVKR